MKPSAFIRNRNYVNGANRKEQECAGDLAIGLAAFMKVWANNHGHLPLQQRAHVRELNAVKS